MYKFFAIALVSISIPIPLYAQQPQTEAPIFRINAANVNGTAPGYWPTINNGLVLNLSSGTSFCNGTIVNYAGGTLTMTASTTNYIYLNTASSCVPAVKTTAFVAQDIPIAIVSTGTATINTITDVRNEFTFNPSSSSSGSLSGGSLGSIPYQSAASVTSFLSGQTSLQTEYLCQTGTGTASAAPVWCLNPVNANVVGTNSSGSPVAATSAEIAAALNTSPSTALSTSLIPTLNYLPLSGGTVTGQINVEYPYASIQAYDDGGTLSSLIVTGNQGEDDWHVDSSNCGQQLNLRDYNVDTSYVLSLHGSGISPCGSPNAGSWASLANLYASQTIQSATLSINQNTSTGTLTTVQLATPAAPTLTASTTGGSLAAGTYTVGIAALDKYGSTAEGTTAAATTTGTTSSIAVSWAAVPNAVSYNVWLSTGQYFNTTSTSYTLTTATGTAGTNPTTNTTGGADFAGPITTPQFIGTVDTLSGATPAINATHRDFTITLSANAVPTVSGITAGTDVNAEICQPSTGGPYTWTWPSAFHGGLTIGTTAGDCSVQTFHSFNGTTLIATSTGVINVAP